MKKTILLATFCLICSCVVKAQSVCDSLVGGITINVALGSNFSPRGTPADRSTELGLAILNSLPSPLNTALNPASPVCVRYSDGITARVDLTIFRTSGLITLIQASEVAGTRRLPRILRTSLLDGSTCVMYQPGTTITLWLTTIWYYPSTGEIVDIDSVPFEVDIGGDCASWSDPGFLV